MIAVTLPKVACPKFSRRSLCARKGVAALNTDLRTACFEALKLSRQRCRDFALGMTWQASTQAFLDAVQAAQTARPVPYAA